MENIEINSGTVLIVDDVEANRYFFSHHLTKAGYTVLEAENGEQGLKMADQNPDLILLDVQLPDISGFEVCSRLKESKHKRIPIIHVSASLTEAAHHFEGIECGADGYVVTPVDPLVLLSTIKTWIRVRNSDKKLIHSVDQLNEEMSMREQFVSTLSHDLRTPLSAARLGASLLAKKLETNSALQTIVGRVIINIERTDNMIRDLLDANMIKAGEKLPLKIEPCSINVLLKDTIQNLINLYGDSFEVHSKDIQGYWDIDAMRRIVENLASNAYKYGDHTHKITLTAEAVNKNLKVSVHNFGNPISAEDQKHLFDSFKRAENGKNEKGWGLGLSLVKGLVEAHSGTIDVKSDAGSGTTFIFTMPLDCRP